MCALTMTNLPPTEMSHLTFRREALLRRDLHKMTSFRLPKETTSQLLHFHYSEDEPENDSATQEKEDKVVELPKFHRRKSALKRSEHRMISFRLPKDKTHQLLAESSSLVVLDEEEEEEENATATKSTPSTTACPSATKTRTTTHTTIITATKSRRRCRALQSLKHRPVMTSFRLPKETTSKLLHLAWDEELDASDNVDADTNAATTASNDCRKPHDTNQRAIPPQLVRQSSFSARTA